MDFRKLGLIAPILRALAELGYVTPSPIQSRAIEPALAGRDVLGCAQTGTGKTCAFAAPILQRLNAAPAGGDRPIRALILTPTRELALQIEENFEAYGKYLPLRSTVIFGGVGQAPQVEKLRRGLDILVATPGRLLDLQGQGLVDLSRVEIFVLDEADRMLDMGFIHDVRRVLKLLPAQKQTMLFSATMPPEVSDLVDRLLRDPVKVAVDPVSSPVEVIGQSVYFVDKGNKTKLLASLITGLNVKNALVFTRTKHGANRVAADLVKAGISAAAIHGNKSQSARQQALADFKSGAVRALVATDIAARGIDIEELSHVFNYNLPEVPETYIHRIGRTGRAGHGGTAIAFCDFAEKDYLKGIEALVGKPIPVVEDHPWPMQVLEVPAKDARGRAVNADDAEARTAARQRAEKRRADKAAAVPAPKAAAEPADALRKKRRPRWKKAEGSQARPLDAVLPERTAGGEANFRDFSRPDPLRSDHIMDATARLLAPRKPPHAARPVHDEADSRNRSGESRRGRAKSGAPVPQKRSGSSVTAAQGSGNRGQDRGRGRKGAPSQAPIHGARVKDSTEQPSLMKPYYLNHD